MVRLTYARVEKLPAREVIGRTRVAIEHALMYAGQASGAMILTGPRARVLIRGRGKQARGLRDRLGSAGHRLARREEPERTCLADRAGVVGRGGGRGVRTDRAEHDRDVVLRRGGPGPPGPSDYREATDGPGRLPSRSWRRRPRLDLAELGPRFMDLVLLGAVFGVPHEKSFAAIAWTYERGFAQDAIGVWTEPGSAGSAWAERWPWP